MAINIVFCADGTWNGPDEDAKNINLSGMTNVFKLFRNLSGIASHDSTRLKDEQEITFVDKDNNLVQIAKYIHGVGDSENFLVKVLGGTFGAGIISRIVRGYTFISRNYTKGDKIFILGFSRGAYTARALAGLITAKGLLDAKSNDLKDNRENAYQLGASVWYEYRKQTIKEDSWIGSLEEIAIDLPGFLQKKAPPLEKMIEAEIAAIGVWDTVGALGIPEYSLASERRVQSMQFVDNKLNDKVLKGFHAISIDDQRSDFTPTLWDERIGIEQRLFPGAHADVGGGYPAGDESGLSDRALEWMIECLTREGVEFAIPAIYQPKPRANGIAHQPSISPPWNVLPRDSRIFPSNLKSNLDPSVNERRNIGPVKHDPKLEPSIYNPKNI